MTIIVPGAWHTPTHYFGLSVLLQQAGFATETLSLPSVDPASPLEADIASDAAAISAALRAHCDAGRDVLLITHSCGSCPGAAAAKGLSKNEGMPQQKAGGIIGLVCIAAVLTDASTRLLVGRARGQLGYLAPPNCGLHRLHAAAMGMTIQCASGLATC